MATGIITSSDYLRHDTGRHPERRERYQVLLDRLKADIDLWQDLLKIEPYAATDQDLWRCHTPAAIERVRQGSLQAAIAGRIALDHDTIISADSEAAARLAAGGACRAVDAVVSGKLTGAFVACRPPGHHATIANAMGFCLYNNVAIAARYAQATYPDQIRRVLIVDFDVHHGNGTQDIFYDDPSVFFFSMHQHPWYPGTGGTDERGIGNGEGSTLNIPVPARLNPDHYLRLFRDSLDRILASFSPDLLLVSAGFDGHESDPLGDLLLTDQCYRIISRELAAVARTTSSGGLVSCLEGGYNLDTLGDTVHGFIAALD